MTGTGPRRYHPFFALGFMRRTLLLYLVPLVQVLFAREWQALWRALAQDLALFCLLALVSAVMLRASSWELDAAGVLHLRWDLILSFERRIQNSQLAAVQIERPMLYCLAGASRVTLYPALLPKGQAVTLHLTRRDARMLADRMMPAPQQEIYHPRRRPAFGLCTAGRQQPVHPASGGSGPCARGTTPPSRSPWSRSIRRRPGQPGGCRRAWPGRSPHGPSSLG